MSLERCLAFPCPKAGLSAHPVARTPAELLALPLAARRLCTSSVQSCSCVSTGPQPESHGCLSHSPSLACAPFEPRPLSLFGPLPPLCLRDVLSRVGQESIRPCIDPPLVTCGFPPLPSPSIHPLSVSSSSRLFCPASSRPSVERIHSLRPGSSSSPSIFLRFTPGATISLSFSALPTLRPFLSSFVDFFFLPQNLCHPATKTAVFVSLNISFWFVHCSLLCIALLYVTSQFTHSPRLRASFFSHTHTQSLFTT